MILQSYNIMGHIKEHPNTGEKHKKSPRKNDIILRNILNIAKIKSRGSKEKQTSSASTQRCADINDEHQRGKDTDKESSLKRYS